MATITKSFEKRASDAESKIAVNKPQFLYGLKRYLLYPIESGLYGLYIIFALLILLKIVSYLAGLTEMFNVDRSDLIFPLLGFMIMFLVDVFKKQ